MEMKKGTVDKLIKANFLDYQVPADINVVDRRSHVRHQFDQQSYAAGQVMTCRLGSGDSYIYGRNSYLSFDLTVGTQDAGFGVGSAINLIRDAELKSSSGAELDHVERVNLFKVKEKAYTMPVSYFFSGKGSSLHYWRDGNGYVPAGTTIQCCIPLCDVLPLFDYDGLLPSLGFISGSTLKITLEDAATAMLWTVGVGTITVSNPVLVAEEYVLTDGVQKRLNEMSGSQGSGLSLVWKSWYHNHTISSAASVELQMANSVSKAVMSFGFLRSEASVAGATADSIASLSSAAITQYRFALGNLRFPDERCTRDAEAYTNALIGFGQYDSIHQPMAGLQGFTTDAVILADENAGWENHSRSGSQTVCTSLERSHILALSGYGVNSDRLLRLNITKSATADRLDMFLVYHRYARVFLDRSVIKI
jgi:hypothetical protein